MNTPEPDHLATEGAAEPQQSPIAAAGAAVGAAASAAVGAAAGAVSFVLGKGDSSEPQPAPASAPDSSISDVSSPPPTTIVSVGSTGPVTYSVLTVPQDVASADPALLSASSSAGFDSPAPETWPLPAAKAPPQQPPDPPIAPAATPEPEPERVPPSIVTVGSGFVPRLPPLVEVPLETAKLVTKPESVLPPLASVGTATVVTSTAPAAEPLPLNPPEEPPSPKSEKLKELADIVKTPEQAAVLAAMVAPAAPDLPKPMAKLAVKLQPLHSHAVGNNGFFLGAAAIAAHVFARIVADHHPAGISVYALNTLDTYWAVPLLLGLGGAALGKSPLDVGQKPTVTPPDATK